MAIVVNFNNYQGVYEAQPYVVPILVKNEWAENALMRIVERRADQISVRKMDTDVTLMPYSPKFITTGSQETISPVVIRPTPISINKEMDPEELRTFWGSEDLDAMFFRRELTPDFQSALLQLVGEKAAQRLSFLASQGDITSSNSQLNLTNGIVKILNDSTAANKVSSPAVLTKSNILAELDKLYAKIPDQIRLNPKYRGKLKIVMNYTTFDAYKNALIETVYKGPFYSATDDEFKLYKAIPIVPIYTMPNDCMIAGVFTADGESNFAMGTNSYSDIANITIAYTGTLDKSVGLAMGFTAGFAVLKEEETAFYYRP